ncbi:hypothetical protein BNJ_00202 [Kaumoebavirus]|uniref:hypothetical protein n=1 Tax=Kaumoebavirus TaxID=1859492 RepID=UPI0009C31205|nr:hypothetical protein BNJ_00202 [Kaumoebavirus]ARA72033.1 hypothetical protein BNJ_00202 [Kaumoebavirus]
MILKISPWALESDPPQLSWTVAEDSEPRKGRVTELIQLLLENGQLPDFLDDPRIYRYLMHYWNQYRELGYQETWDRVIKKLAKIVEAKDRESFVVDVRRTWGRGEDPCSRFQFGVRFINRAGETWEKGYNKNELYDLLIDMGQLRPFADKF